MSETHPPNRPQGGWGGAEIAGIDEKVGGRGDFILSLGGVGREFKILPGGRATQTFAHSPIRRGVRIKMFWASGRVRHSPNQSPKRRVWIRIKNAPGEWESTTLSRPIARSLGGGKNLKCDGRVGGPDTRPPAPALLYAS